MRWTENPVRRVRSPWAPQKQLKMDDLKVMEQKIDVAYFTEFGIRHSIMTLAEIIPFSKRFKLCSMEYVK